MPLRGGRLTGLAQLRDGTAKSFEAQLDELARGLVEAFAETDQSGGGGPAAAGLFTYSGGPAVPASGTLVSGLAASIRINPAADPSQGGTLQRLRDGGINGANYVYNSTGASSFATRLNALVGALSADRNFDTASGLSTTQNLSQFAAASTGWLDGLRKTTDIDRQFQTSLVTRASDALSNATGVNLDDEYALQLQLEQSYAAASKLIGVVNELFDALMQNV
jgi:flagellar hook-associated protein 1 FlgK